MQIQDTTPHGPPSLGGQNLIKLNGKFANITDCKYEFKTAETQLKCAI